MKSTEAPFTLLGSKDLDILDRWFGVTRWSDFYNGYEFSIKDKINHSEPISSISFGLIYLNLEIDDPIEYINSYVSPFSKDVFRGELDDMKQVPGLIDHAQLMLFLGTSDTVISSEQSFRYIDKDGKESICIKNIPLLGTMLYLANIHDTAKKILSSENKNIEVHVEPNFINFYMTLLGRIVCSNSIVDFMFDQRPLSSHMHNVYFYRGRDYANGFTQKYKND